MMSDISSLSFFNYWCKVTAVQKDALLKIYHINKEFTKSIFHNDEAIVKGVAKLMSLNCYSNYYSLDAVFFKNDDRVPDTPINSNWFRNIQIAFEHENYFKRGLYQEVSHLLITNCLLRVLVTYPGTNEETELDRLHTIIKGTPFSTKISDEESFLIIFGYEENFTYRGMVYKESGWQDLTV